MASAFTCMLLFGKCLAMTFFTTDTRTLRIQLYPPVSGFACGVLYVEES